MYQTGVDDCIGGGWQTIEETLAVWQCVYGLGCTENRLEAHLRPNRTCGQKRLGSELQNNLLVQINQNEETQV